MRVAHIFLRVRAYNTKYAYLKPSPPAGLNVFGALVQLAPRSANVPVALVHFPAPSVRLPAPAWLAYAAAAHWL